MKKYFLLLIVLSATTLVQGQKVKMTKDAKKKYMSKEVKEKQEAEENKIAVYAILRSESEPNSDFLSLKLDESTRELATKAATMKFPELEKLTRAKFSAKSEVDLLNYLSEGGWEIVTITNERDKKIIKRKYYLKKMVSI